MFGFRRPPQPDSLLGLNGEAPPLHPAETPASQAKLLAQVDRLAEHFEKLAGWMGQAAAEMKEPGLPPSQALVETLSDASKEFAALRTQVLSRVPLGDAGTAERIPSSVEELRALMDELITTEGAAIPAQPAPAAAEEDAGQSVDEPARGASNSASASADVSAENLFAPASDSLPVEVEAFLDKLIEEAIQAVQANKVADWPPDGAQPDSAPASQAMWEAVQPPATEPPPKRKPPVAAPPAADDPLKAPPGAHSPSHGLEAAAMAHSSHDATDLEAQGEPQRGASFSAATAGSPEYAELLKMLGEYEKSARGAAAGATVSEERRSKLAAAPPLHSVEAPGPGSRLAPNPVPTHAAPPAEAPPRGKDYSEAIRQCRNALELAEQRLGPYHPEIADLLGNLALLYHRQQDFAQAEALHQRSLAIRQDVFGPEHPKVATTLNNLAQLYRDQGRLAEAQTLWEKSLAIVEAVFGPEHSKTALRVANIADLLYSQGNYGNAEVYYKRLLAVLEKQPSASRSASTIRSLRNYALLLRDTRRPKEAQQLLERLKAL